MVAILILLFELKRFLYANLKTRVEKRNLQFNLFFFFLNFQLIPRIKNESKSKFLMKTSLFLSIDSTQVYIFEKLVTIIFASVFKLSVHCTYSIGYRKCSPFFFFFMAFSWPFFLSFYTQDIACRHSLGELSLKRKKNLNALHIFSLLGFLFFTLSHTFQSPSVS